MKTFRILAPITLTRADTYPAIANGCSFKGIYVIANYSRIKELIGAATLLSKDEGDDKVQAQWILTNDARTKVITVYDYKEYKKKYTAVTNWHIGGNYTKEEALIILKELGFTEDELEYNKD